MTTVVIRIDMPPKGALETTGAGSSSTDEEMEEEQKYRQEFMDHIEPKLASLPEMPSTRSGNVSRVELLGGNVWSELNHYLLLLTVDIGDPRVDLSTLAPPGGEVSVIGSYSSLKEWPEQSST